MQNYPDWQNESRHLLHLSWFLHDTAKHSRLAAQNLWFTAAQAA